MTTDPNTQPLEQEEWLDDEPRARGGIPGWAKFCGCGCLLVIGLVVTLAIVIGGKVRDGFDAERQWANLDKALHYDVRPEPITPVFGWQLMWPFILLNDERGYMWIVRVQEVDEAQFREAIFAEHMGVRDPVLNFESVEGEELASVEVQGRELRVKRFLQSGNPYLMMAAEGSPVGGQSLLVDLTPEGSKGMVVVLLVEVGADEPISDDELRELLAPFHVGTDRVPYVAPPPPVEPAEPAPPEEDR